MSKASIMLLLAAALICYLGFTHTKWVVRGVLFLVSLFSAFNAHVFFEHAVLFREKWKTATTGKRRTPPGQSIVTGSTFLLSAILLMALCFYF